MSDHIVGVVRDNLVDKTSWTGLRRHASASVAGAFFGVLLAASAAADGPPTGSSLSFTDVFVGGQEGYPVYRIPALIVTPKGTLLALAEGRATRSDQAENDIVLKRSADGGKTWLPLQVVAEDGASSLNNPTAVIVRETGRVLLMFNRYPPGTRERKVAPGVEGTNVCGAFLTCSDDDGATWSKPRDITAQVKRPVGVTSLACGPGIGIQLRRGPQAGRVIVPFNQGPPNQWKVYAAFSDDRGASWQMGECAPCPGQGQGNEVQVAEMADGSVLLNARNQGGAHLRKIAISRDGGATWPELTDDPNLPEPACQGSLIRHPNAGNPGQDVMLFCNPATPHARTNGVVRLSRDEGKSWPISRVIYPGSFAYSCLATLPDGSVGLLFERDNYARVTFCRFTLDWFPGAK